jgi:hypothetical protein
MVKPCSLEVYNNYLVVWRAVARRASIFIAYTDNPSCYSTYNYKVLGEGGCEDI